jgi:hypothetical protein
MGEMPHAFRFVVRSAFCRDPPVLRDGLCDRGIQAPVENVEFLGRDGSPLLRCQIGDGLTDVAIVVRPEAA